MGIFNVFVVSLLFSFKFIFFCLQRLTSVQSLETRTSPLFSLSIIRINTEWCPANCWTRNENSEGVERGVFQRRREIKKEREFCHSPPSVRVPVITVFFAAEYRVSSGTPCNYDFIFMDINYTVSVAVSLHGILIQGCRHNGKPTRNSARALS